VKKLVVGLLTGLVVASLSSSAGAFPGYLADFIAKYPNNANITCGVCHVVQSPGDSARNPYGQAFEARPHGTSADNAAAFTALEPLDADGDGYTNLTEITATTATVLVLPGFAAADPAFPAAAGFRPTPPRLLFADNFSNVVLTTVPDWTFQGGVWRGNTVGANILLTSPPAAAQTFATPNPPVALPPLAAFGAGTLQARVQLISATTGDKAGFFFGRTASGLRYVEVSRTAILIGQTGGTVKRIANTTFANFKPHVLKVTIGAQTANGSLVRVFVDGALVGSRTFPTLATGTVGFRTRLTRARFDDVRFSR
jgi:hypothetical protein